MVEPSQPRSEFSLKNCDQPSGAKTMIGRLMISQLAKVQPTSFASGTQARWRRHSRISAPPMNAGHSFSATPTPVATPAQPGRRLAQKRKMATAAAQVSRSKLVKAWTMTRGEAAISSVSHTRLPVSFVIRPVAISQNRARKNALTPK